MTEAAAGEMDQRRIRAVYMRGGTSKAVIFRSEDLPSDRREWDAIFLSVMGSPDPYQRQLDGMGGGISSLSKVCVVGPSSRDDADVDYTFAQVSVNRAVVDYSGNCGNMSSAIGPFALEEGLVPLPEGSEAVVRIHNTNTSKLIVARFECRDGHALVSGDQVILGVAGSGAPIRLEFMEPGGARTSGLLPTGNPVDLLELEGRQIRASMIDASNPCIFVAASDLGCSGLELPDELEAREGLLSRLEAVRRAGAVLMGLASNVNEAAGREGNPKVAMIASPGTARLLTGDLLQAEDYDIAVRMLSMGRPHRAIPVTGAICSSVACRVPGSLLNELVPRSGQIRIGHPSGVTDVDAEVDASSLHAIHGTVYRTARRLFEGSVLYVPRRFGSPQIDGA